MGKYLLGIITALIFIAAIVIWFSRPGQVPANTDGNGTGDNSGIDAPARLAALPQDPTV